MGDGNSETDQKKTSRTANDLPNLDKGPLQPASLVRLSPPDPVFPNIYRNFLRIELIFSSNVHNCTFAPTKKTPYIQPSSVDFGLIIMDIPLLLSE
jgi:hypothetical protein